MPGTICYLDRQDAQRMWPEEPRPKTPTSEIPIILGHRPESAPDTLHVFSGRRNFYRIVVFNAVLFGVGVHSALKSPFTSAFILEE